MTVIACVDFSASAEPVVAAAARLAGPGGSVTLVHVFRPPLLATSYAGMTERASYATEAVAAESLVALRRLCGEVRSMHRILYGEPGPAIVEELRRTGADLVVLGRRRHAGLRHLMLGSAAAHVLRHAACPVVVVPPS